MDDERKKSRPGRPIANPGGKPTKERILEAAIDLFSQRGYDGTSLKEIAGAVSLTESAIYKHYPCKEAVLDAVFELADREIYSPLPIEDNLGSGENGSIFRGLLAPLPRIIGSDETMVVKIFRIMFIEMHRNAKIRGHYRKEYVGRANEYMAALFARCVEKGTIRECDTFELARVFNSYRAEWAFQNFIIHPEGKIDIEELEKDMERTIEFFEQNFLSEDQT